MKARSRNSQVTEALIQSQPLVTGSADLLKKPASLSPSLMIHILPSPPAAHAASAAWLAEPLKLITGVHVCRVADRNC